MYNVNIFQTLTMTKIFQNEDLTELVPGFYSQQSLINSGKIKLE